MKTLSLTLVLLSPSAFALDFKFLGCEDPEACPPQHGVALSIRDGRVAGLCNAAMIGPSAVVTDEHCVRDFGFRTDSECRDRIVLLFPKANSHGREVREVKCHKVLSKSEPGDDFSPGDYAFLSVAETLSEALRPDASPVKDGEKLVIKKWSFAKDGRSATYSAENCTVLHSPLMRPTMPSGFDPEVFLSGCQSIPGNSGSALVDARGNFRGSLLGRSLSSGYEDSARKALGTLAPPAPAERPLIMSPAACMRYFFEGVSMPADCVLRNSERQTKGEQLWQEALNDVIHRKTRTITDAWLRLSPKKP